MWIWIIVIVAIIGAIIGIITKSNDDSAAEGCLTGGCMGATSAGYCLLQLFFLGLSIWLIIALFNWLFG